MCVVTVKSLLDELVHDNDEAKERLCAGLVHYLFRNGPVEGMHADNKLSQEDMKTLNKFMMNKVRKLIDLGMVSLDIFDMGILHKILSEIGAGNLNCGKEWDKSNPNEIFTRGHFVTLSDGEDGYVTAECKELPGCISQGKGMREAITNIMEAIDLWKETKLLKDKEIICELIKNSDSYEYVRFIRKMMDDESKCAETKCEGIEENKKSIYELVQKNNSYKDIELMRKMAEYYNTGCNESDEQ